MKSDEEAELFTGSSPGTAAAVLELEQRAGSFSEHHHVAAGAQTAARRHVMSWKSKRGKRLNTNQRHALEIRALEREVADKLALANQLEVEHSRLQIEHQLLVECCNSLQLLRVQHGKEEEVVQDELALLEQLQGITYDVPAIGSGSMESSSNTADKSGHERAASGCSLTDGPAAAESAPAGPAAQDLLQQQLSPPHDRMYYFRHLLSLPPLPGIEHCTVEDLVADYASTVHTIALQLHIIQRPSAGGASCAAHPAQKMKELVDRHLRILASLMLRQREDLVQRFSLTNFETLETNDDPTLHANTWLIQAAGITEEQQADIAVGMRLFDRILAPIMEERLQQQTAELQQAPHGSQKYRHQLELQQKRVERLALLCRKEYQLRFAAACWVVGHLTYQQLCVLLVKSAPVSPSLLQLGKIMQEQQQQSSAKQSQ